MAKKIAKIVLLLIMIIGVIIAVSNFSSINTEALDGEWEKLTEYDAGNGNIIYYCKDEGSDCMVVRPPVN